MPNIDNKNQSTWFEGPRDWGINSFQDTCGYKQYDPTPNWMTLIATTIKRAISNPGLYVLNINYNIESYKPVFRVKIGNDYQSAEFNRGYIAFYTPGGLAAGTKVLIEYKYSRPSNQCPLYIKNIGLYRVVDSTTGVDNSVSVSTICQTCKDKSSKKVVFLDEVGDKEQVEKLYTGIIFPTVFCFKEVKNENQSIGCLDKEFSGFQELPKYSFQKCAAVYGLNEDLKTAHVLQSRFLDNNSGFQDLVRTTIDNIPIRQKL